MEKIKNYKMHIIDSDPHGSVETIIGKVNIYKSLCGVVEPHKQTYGNIMPTCEKCLKIKNHNILRMNRRVK